MNAPESRLGRAYSLLYELLCGRHPALMPWHFQWLTAHFLNRDLQRWLPHMEGRVLDVGCGKRPYLPLFKVANEVVGIDTAYSHDTDVVVSTDAGWPFQDNSFDVILMTQVLEYMDDANATMAEIRRVLKPAGIAIVSFPFIYNEHGVNDRLRFSANLSGRVFKNFRALSISRQGGIGSTVAILFLNWLDLTLNRRFATRLLRPLLLPLWLPLCLLVNIVALLLNRLDKTNVFYGNVFLVLERVKDTALAIHQEP